MTNNIEVIPLTPRMTTNYNDVEQPTLFISSTKKCIAEFIGTYAFIFIALAAANQANLTSMLHNEPSNPILVAAGFGIGLTIGINLSGSISGGHLNPSVSLVFLILGKITSGEFVLYLISQLLGAFLAAFTVFVLYYNTINLYPYTIATAGAFGTYKQTQVSIGIGCLEQIIGTAILIISILYCTSPYYKGNAPISIGLTLFVIAICLGTNGFAINPARDLGPRLMSAIFWGREVFSYQDNWWWVPIVGSFCGAPIGLTIYKLYEKFINN